MSEVNVSVLSVVCHGVLANRGSIDYRGFRDYLIALSAAGYNLYEARMVLSKPPKMA